MRIQKYRLARDGGWTFIEATLAVVIMSIMVLGLSIVLMAFREHLDRSWAVRVMDQYGNDVVERLTHELRNAVDVTVYGGTGDNYHRIVITYLDPYHHDRFITSRWNVDTRTTQVKIENQPVDPTFPPRDLGRGESYEICRFTLTGYGVRTEELSEIQDWPHRDQSFLSATYDITFMLRYNRAAINPGERHWKFEKEYKNRVYMRNKNLIVKKGITE